MSWKGDGTLQKTGDVWDTIYHDNTFDKIIKRYAQVGNDVHKPNGLKNALRAVIMSSAWHYNATCHLPPTCHLLLACNNRNILQRLNTSVLLSLMHAGGAVTHRTTVRSICTHPITNLAAFIGTDVVSDRSMNIKPWSLVSTGLNRVPNDPFRNLNTALPASPAYAVHRVVLFALQFEERHVRCIAVQ